jgi:hypothetical protein
MALQHGQAPDALQFLNKAEELQKEWSAANATALGEMRCAAHLLLARDSPSIDQRRKHLRSANRAIEALIEGDSLMRQHSLYLAALVQAEARNVIKAKTLVQR